MITIIIVSTITLILLVFIIILIITEAQRRKMHFVKEKSILQTQFQHALLQTQLEIQEQTMKNISQEIHDNIGQMLSLAKLNLNRMDPAKQEDLLQKINDSKSLVGKAIQDLRDLSKSMNTDFITALGLVKALEYEMELIQKAGALETELTVSGQVQKLDPKKELILFRIIQETLNNIIKHADAQKVEVKANYLKDALALEISDNGKGFEAETLQEEGNDNQGLGIRNMRNRALLIGAEFTINSKPGNGTQTKISLPLNQ